MGGLGALQFSEVDLAMAVVEPQDATADVFELGEAGRMSKEVFFAADFLERRQPGGKDVNATTSRRKIGRAA